MATRRKHKVESWLLSRISSGYRLEKEYLPALPSKSLRYFVAIAATAVAVAARFLLEPALGDVAPLLVFTLSVMVSAWYGGLGPGLLATALGLLLGDYFFIAESVAERIEEALFLGIGVSIWTMRTIRTYALSTIRAII